MKKVWIGILLFLFIFFLTSCSQKEKYVGEYKAVMIYPIQSSELAYEDDVISIRLLLL